LLFVGRLDKGHTYKGMDRVLALMQFFKESPEGSEVMMTVIGGGPLLPSFEKIARQRDLKNIVFLGSTSDKILDRELREADALLVPSSSRGEGFSMTALEAMASGTPVILSNNVGLSGLAQQYGAAIVVDFTDVSSAGRSIRNLLRDSNARGTLVERAREMLSAEGMTLEDRGRAMEGVYSSVLANFESAR